MFESPESPELLNGDAPMLEASLASDDLETLLARRASPRKRALRAGLVALPVLIALAVVFLTFPGALPAWTRIGARETATPTVARSNIASVNSANAITVSSNVNFGTLTLNGKRVPGHMPWQITLAKGNNTVTLSAAPFVPRPCSIRTPIQPGPGTSFAASGLLRSSECNFFVSGGNAGTIQALDIRLGGNDLPPVLRDRALATVKFALATAPGYTISVPVGDYYAAGLDANGLPAARRATEPLTAQLAYALADSVAPPGALSFGCGQPPCPGVVDLVAPITAPVWIIAIAVAQVWSFTTSSGEVAGQVSEPTWNPSMLALSYDPSGWWRISNAFDMLGSGPGAPAPTYADPCGTAMQMLWQVQGLPSGLGVSSSNSASGGPQGCKLQAVDQGNSPQATFIYLFGVLLAADDGAHKFLPALPMAPPSEVAAVG